MNVLHVGPIGISGPSHSIRGLAAGQVKAGMEVAILSSMPLAPDTTTEKVTGVHWLGDIPRPHHNPWHISLDWVVRIQGEFGTPDIVDFHSTYIPFQTALARLCRKVDWPYIVTPRGGMTCLAQNVKRIKKASANLLFYRSYVKDAVAVHALCDQEADDIRKLFKPNRLIVVPNGVEDFLLRLSETLSPIDLRSFRQSDDLVLGFVGRIDIYHKGLDLLLKAMAILRSQSVAFRTKLFVIGPFYTGKDRRDFHAIVESLDLKDDVGVLGPKYGQEKLRYFLSCDVFIHTSRFEGMPMAVLEAMALGCPCLVTPGTNMADIVSEVGGWVCQPDPESIAKAIKSIHSQRDSLKELGRQAHQLIRERFTWPKIAEQMNNEYTKLLTD